MSDQDDFRLVIAGIEVPVGERFSIHTPTVEGLGLSGHVQAVITGKSDITLRTSVEAALALEHFGATLEVVDVDWWSGEERGHARAQVSAMAIHRTHADLTLRLA